VSRNFALPCGSCSAAVGISGPWFGLGELRSDFLTPAELKEAGFKKLLRSLTKPSAISL